MPKHTPDIATFSRILFAAGAIGGQAMADDALTLMKQEDEPTVDWLEQASTSDVVAVLYLWRHLRETTGVDMPPQAAILGFELNPPNREKLALWIEELLNNIANTQKEPNK